jgi:hypothetical protein
VGGGELRRSTVLRCAFVLASAVLTGCSTLPGNSETDRIARVVADAISYPRQQSAAGYATAALATAAAKDGLLQVVKIEESDADELTDPLGRLIFLVHLEGSGSGFSRVEPVTACYQATFNYYGIIDKPSRTGCPPNPVPVMPATTAPKPVVTIPEGSDAVVKQVLQDAPPAPDAQSIRGRLVDALPGAGTNPVTGLTDVVATPEVATRGGDIGVALFGPESRSCLLGARVGGEALVWRPSRIQVQPGELSCDPQTALAKLGIHPPH